VKVVLLHAFPLDERMWEPQRPALAEFDVTAPRLYRLGGSLDEWAGAVLERVEGELVAVGASMGGYSALAMARQAPERVRGLVLAGSRAAADSADRRAQREATITTLREQGVESWYRASGNPAPADAVLDQSAEDLIRAMQVLRDRADASDVVRAFPGPLLVAVGGEDELLSVDEARAIAASAPEGRVEVFPGAGHLISLEQPERFNALLSEFLEPWR
jgi:pimeloyl-ACP methyl ester carboxylesterase